MQLSPVSSAVNESFPFLFYLSGDEVLLVTHLCVIKPVRHGMAIVKSLTIQLMESTCLSSAVMVKMSPLCQILAVLAEVGGWQASCCFPSWSHGIIPSQATIPPPPCGKTHAGSLQVCTILSNKDKEKFRSVSAT